MNFKNLNIIGGGPNCVYALEILLKKILQKRINQKKTIRIFEKTGMIGCGKTHSKNLDKDILLNRVAGQISLGSYPFLKFPNRLKKYDYNFMEWKNKQNDKKITELSSTDWPARYIFGLSLETKFFDLLKIFREFTNVNLEIYNKEVLSINCTDKITETITADKKKYPSDKTLVVTGNYISHVKSSRLSNKLFNLTNNTNCDFEYNFLDNLDKKKYWEKFKKKKIVIFGTGVSSLDVISMLSNKNNKIYPFSRTFLFPFARPLNKKLSNPKKLEHRGLLLNKKLIKSFKLKLINKKLQNKIKLKFSLLPIIKSEFYSVYFEKYLKKKNYILFKRLLKKEFNQKKLKNKINFNAEDQKIEYQLREFIRKKSFNKKFYKENWFSRKKVLSQILNENLTFFDFFVNPLINEKDNFSKQYLKFLSWDINEASKGNLSSSFKKACDGVWRDLRPHFTELFDDCENQSFYKEFIDQMLPIHNRLADGPSLEIIIKIKRMIKNKEINFNFKNSFRFLKKNNFLFLSNNKNRQEKIDVVFLAIANLYKENFIGDRLLLNMSKNDIIELKSSQKNKKTFLNLNKFQSPINKKGREFKNITFIGPASEGPKFFHHTLSRPDKKQFNIIDLENWVKRL